VFAPKVQENRMNVPEQIAHEVGIAVPVERVWAMLTEADHVHQWFAFAGGTMIVMRRVDSIARHHGDMT
jgi:uncharacterized protein YndB with AHSA1/START domain